MKRKKYKTIQGQYPSQLNQKTYVVSVDAIDKSLAKVFKKKESK